MKAQRDPPSRPPLQERATEANRQSTPAIDDAGGLAFSLADFGTSAEATQQQLMAGQLVVFNFIGRQAAVASTGSPAESPAIARTPGATDHNVPR